MTIKEFVNERKIELKKEFSSLRRRPTLVIVQVNEDPATDAYIRGKIKDGTELGVNVELKKFPVTFTQDELLNEISKLNNDDSVDGFIVQMPIPSSISEEVIKLAISPKKDVDGFHPLSKLNPCTPQGIMNYLNHEGFVFKGKNAVVIGRSYIVGKPMAKLLLNESANVTVLHSKTSEEDKAFYIKHADLIVVATGKMHLLDEKYEYNPNAVIVDVGISRDETGLHGDAKPNLPVHLQTPVPGGVGLLTRITLFENLLKIVKQK